VRLNWNERFFWKTAQKRIQKGMNEKRHHLGAENFATWIYSQFNGILQTGLCRYFLMGLKT
jgi:hypothetical protein